jgi:hypothetical protein
MSNNLERTERQWAHFFQSFTDSDNPGERSLGIVDTHLLELNEILSRGMLVEHRSTAELFQKLPVMLNLYMRRPTTTEALLAMYQESGVNALIHDLKRGNLDFAMHGEMNILPMLAEIIETPQIAQTFIAESVRYLNSLESDQERREAVLLFAAYVFSVLPRSNNSDEAVDMML